MPRSKENFILTTVRVSDDYKKGVTGADWCVGKTTLAVSKGLI